MGASTPNDYEVSYLYDVEDGAGRNTIRRSRQTIAYAASTIEWTEYQYLSSSDRFDDDASRVTQLYSKDGVTYASYDYIGMSAVVGIEYPEPDVYRRLYGSSQGDYPDWDRFNRQINSTWAKDLSTDVNFYDVDYSYDRNGNITWSEDNVYPGRDVLYTADNLNRLTDADEGTRSGGSITSRVRREQWSLQQMGNWDLFKLDLNGDGDWSDTNEVQDKGTFVTSGGTGFNELRGRDIDNNASVDITRTYDKNGNLTDDGLVYHYKYDAFNRLRKLLDRDDGTTLLHEYVYNGVGHRVGWWNLSDNQWIYFAYDESWRMVASYLTTDTTPKEIFINHQAGMNGRTMSLGLDATVARMKDASVSWTTATDGVWEERVYYCQEFRSGRADVVHLIDTVGGRVESVRYSPYGVPFGIPYVDFNADGAKTSADQTLLTAANGSSAGGVGYNVACDIDLDGVIGATEASLYSSYSGGTLGRGNMSRNIVRNRRGYAGYEHDGSLDNLMHARHRTYESERGRWLQRDPLRFIDSSNVYSYVTNRPLSLTDPSGLASIGDIIAGWDFSNPGQLRHPRLGGPGYHQGCLVAMWYGTGVVENCQGGWGYEPEPDGGNGPSTPDGSGRTTLPSGLGSVVGPHAAIVSSLIGGWSPLGVLGTMEVEYNFLYGQPMNDHIADHVLTGLEHLLGGADPTPAPTGMTTAALQSFRRHRGWLAFQPKNTCDGDSLQSAQWTEYGRSAGYSHVGIIGTIGMIGPFAAVSHPTLTGYPNLVVAGSSCATWNLKDASAVNWPAPMGSALIGQTIPYVWRDITYSLCCDGSYSVNYSGSTFPTQSAYLSYSLLASRSQGSLSNFVFSGGVGVGYGALAPGGLFAHASGNVTPSGPP